jgi:hypothetical protein
MTPEKQGAMQSTRQRDVPGVMLLLAAVFVIFLILVPAVR